MAKLFVGGLSPMTTGVDLGNYFARYTWVLKAEVKVDASGRKRGFGFVDIGDVGSLRRILSDTHTVGGRQVAVSLYVPNIETTALVTNLHPTITSDELDALFRFYDPAVHIQQHPDPFTGLLNMSHCYVRFKDKKAFSDVVDRQYHWIRGIRLKCWGN